MRILLSLFLPLALLACSPEDPFPQLGLANPASVYCADQGGKIEIRDTEEGQVGDCHLSDGRVVEEWEFYRAATE